MALLYVTFPIIGPTKILHDSLNLNDVRDDHIMNGLKNSVFNTGFKGRWQILQEEPKVICDTAHNKEGLTYVMKQLLQENFEKLHIILGVVNDKKLDDVLSFFPKHATYYFCKPNIPRGLDEQELKDKATPFGLQGEVFDSVSKAYKKALSQANQADVIFVGGSTFVVAEVL